MSVTIAIPQMGSDLFRKYMKSKYVKSLERAGAVVRWIELDDTEKAVAEALSTKKIYAVGIDVLTEEPPLKGSPLISAPRCYITPHIAWASKAARRRLIDIAISNVKAFAWGEPQNQV